MSDLDVLVERNVDWARQIARHVAGMLPTWFTEDDLIGAAEVALVQLAGKYEPSRGIPFRGYARRRVYGACFDSIRRREYKEHTHLPLGYGEPADAGQSPEADAIATDTQAVWGRVQELPPRHALVILAIYAGDMTLVELSQMVDVGPARLSQIHREALAMLRENLAA